MTQFAGASEPVAATADGFTSGTLVTFALGNGGEITGVYTNGQTQILGQIAMASFLNPAGLLRAGQNTFQTSSALGHGIDRRGRVRAAGARSPPVRWRCRTSTSPPSSPG